MTTRSTPPNPIHDIMDFLHAMTEFNKRSPVHPVAAVIPSSSKLADLGQASIRGLAIATDASLFASQVIFFTCPQEFTRYTSQIRK